MTEDANDDDRHSTTLGDTTTANDSQTTLAELKEIMQAFVDERQWQTFHNPKNLAMSLAIETAELMEHFQWRTLEESARMMDDANDAHAIGEEVADCLAYLLSIANCLDIDLASTFRAKMIRNAQKYPPAQ